jgi:hypothetical protein
MNDARSAIALLNEELLFAAILFPRSLTASLVRERRWSWRRFRKRRAHGLALSKGENHVKQAGASWSVPKYGGLRIPPCTRAAHSLFPLQNS